MLMGLYCRYIKHCASILNARRYLLLLNVLPRAVTKRCSWTCLAWEWAVFFNQHINSDVSVIQTKSSSSSAFVEKTMKFPLMPMIAGLVVVGLTALLAVIARWQKIVKVKHKTYIYTDQRLTVIRYKMNLLILSFSFDSALSRSLLHQMREVMKKSPLLWVHETAIAH